MRPFLAWLAVASAAFAQHEPGLLGELRGADACWRVRVESIEDTGGAHTAVAVIEAAYKAGGHKSGETIRAVFDAQAAALRIQRNLMRGVPGWTGRFYVPVPGKGERCVLLVRAKGEALEIVNCCALLVPFWDKPVPEPERAEDLDAFFSRYARMAAVGALEAPGLLAAALCEGYAKTRLGEYEDKGLAALEDDAERAITWKAPGPEVKLALAAGLDSSLKALSSWTLDDRVRLVRRLPWLISHLDEPQRRLLAAKLMTGIERAAKDLETVNQDPKHGTPACSCGVVEDAMSLDNLLYQYEAQLRLAICPSGHAPDWSRETLMEEARKFAAGGAGGR